MAKKKTVKKGPSAAQLKKAKDESISQAAIAKMVAASPPPTYMMLPVGRLIPTLENPRKLDRKGQAYKDLLESVRASGVRIPVAVRPHPTKSGFYDLRAGARRLAAAMEAGQAEIPSLVYEKMSDEEAFEITFTENFARQDLSPLEESEAVAVLIDHYKGDCHAVATRLGKGERWVRLRRRIRLCLCETWRKAAAADGSPLTASHLEIVARFAAPTQEAMHKELYRYRNDDLTVEDVRRMAIRYMRDLGKAMWSLDEEVGVGKKQMPKCSGCAKRSSCEPMLFDDAGEKGGKAKKSPDLCLDPACWDRKAKAVLDAKVAEMRKEHPKLILLQDGHSPDPAYKEARSDYSVQKCAKGEKGAVAAMYVTGLKKGEMAWVKPQPRGASRTATRTPAKPAKIKWNLPDGPVLAKTMRKLDEKFEDVKTVPASKAAWRLLAIAMLGDLDTYTPKDREKVAATLDKIRQGDVNALALDAALVFFNVTYACAFHAHEGVGGPRAEDVEIAKLACEVLDWDWQAEYDKVVDEVKKEAASSEKPAAGKNKEAKKSGSKKEKASTDDPAEADDGEEE